MSVIELREHYHHQICREIIRANEDQNSGGYPNFADGSNRSSVGIAWGIVNRLRCEPNVGRLPPQTIGNLFESITKDFLEQTFQRLQHLRPGDWLYATESTAISGFEQYEHLARIDELVGKDNDLASALGGDYIIKPDIVIGRHPVTDNRPLA